MKHSLKQKFLRAPVLIVGTLMVLSVLIVGGPFSSKALAATTPCPTGETRQNENLCCPKGQAAAYTLSNSNDSATQKKENAENKAAARSCCPSHQATDGASACLFAKYVNPLIGLLAALVGIVVVGSIIYGGILYSTSGGDPQKAAKGKDHIRNALLGLLAYILLYGFIQFMVPGGKFHV